MATALLLLLACGPSSGDSATFPGAGSVPGGTTSAGTQTATGSGERLELGSGEVVEGEVIARYDQRIWQWTPANETWLAVFDPALWEGGEGVAVRFLRESEVVATEPVAVSGLSWRESLREAGLGWERPPLDGVGWVITGNDSYHLEEDGYGDFAWDLVRTDPSGARYTGNGAANADYRVWGDPVYAARGGVVVEVVRDAPDNPPGSYSPGAVNNLVGIAVGGQLVQYYLHFRQGSIPAGVVVGAQVAAGDLLGEVGNSGVTLEPHLHVTLHAWSAGPPARYWSVPSEWADLELADAPSGSSFHGQVVPQSGQWVSRDPF